MICDECGESANIRFFVPVQNPLKRMLNSVSENQRQGKWVCEKCLTKMKKTAKVGAEEHER